MISRFFTLPVQEFEPEMQNGTRALRRVRSFNCYLQQVTAEVDLRPYGNVVSIDAVMYSDVQPSVGNFIKYRNTFYRVMNSIEVKDMYRVRFYRSILEKVNDRAVSA